MINVIGLGYIGLPTALMLASANADKVTGTDINNELIDSLNRGKLSFKEAHLPEIFDKARQHGIEFTTDYIAADIYIISVPTPYNKKTKKVEPIYILEALKEVLNSCGDQAIIIIESTISPGTIDNFVRPIVKERAGGRTIHIVHAPERIIPGNMFLELKNNPRTIGADSYEIGAIVKNLYGSFCDGEIVITDIKSAEMSKVVENTFRDINIAFANELAKICNEGQMDVYEIIRIANNHPRVNILQPGPGVGGHCISVDPWFLVGDYPKLTNLITAARNVNNSMPDYVYTRLLEIMRKNNISDFSKVGFYGLTYKENVDDVRESPMLQLIESLEQKKSEAVKQVHIFDPLVRKKIVDMQMLDFREFIATCEIIVIMTGHDHIEKNIECFESKIILDTKNVLGKGVYKL